MATEQFSHKEDQVKVLDFCFWGSGVLLGSIVSESLRHDVEEELKTVSCQVNLCAVESINELIDIDVAIARCVCRSQGLLERNPLGREGLSSDLLHNLLRSVKIDLLVELDLLSVMALD